jgi:hypothetical protein
MKNILAVLILIICVGALQAQTKGLDSKLLVKYSQKEIKKLKKNNPQEYKFLDYCSDNAFYVANSSAKKVAENSTAYGEITISDIANINFHALKIELKQSEFQAFVIKGTDKLLMVRSKDFIELELKKK